MQMRAASFFTLEPDSQDAGRLTGQGLLEALAGQSAKVVLVYATTNHDQAPLLAGLREALGADTTIVGCSVQGAVGNGELTEEGLVVAAMAFAGDDVESAAAMQRDVHIGSEAKGEALAKALKGKLGGEPVVTIVLYDPLCGANVEALLNGMRREVTSPVIGGGSGQPWGPPVATFQYWGEEVLSHSVVALGLRGPFAVELGICHGTAPTGFGMTITKSDGNRILEIDGRPALDVWRESTGYIEQSDATVHQSYLAAWAIGLQRPGEVDGPASAELATVIRGAFGFDLEAGAVVVQAAIPAGTRVMFHHRTVENVLGGTERLAHELSGRLAGRVPWAVLGFECAARTYPFLGPDNTLKQHRQLRGLVAPEAPWLGMMAWGEVGPSGGEPAFHNYTYPLVVFTDRSA